MLTAVNNTPWLLYRSGKVVDSQQRPVCHFIDVRLGAEFVAQVNGNGTALPAPDPVVPDDLRVAMIEWIRAEDENAPVKNVRPQVLQIARRWLKPVV